jgi:extracellular elastinolytic metalloproteinase
MHDFLFILGFDEAAGNFQQINFTNTGLANDAVRARAHSGAVSGTANMLTHPDGHPPVMNMGLVTGVGRHTAFDADVVFHEYVHGLTNRLVGGALNAEALRRPQSRGMGEGWSDYYALTVIGYITGTEKVVSGDWVTGQPAGIRSARYDDNYPIKYGGIRNLSGEHRIGEVWCATLMMMTRKARHALGSDADGYRVCWQIVTDGLKLAPANPSFLQARDSILLALDQLRDIQRLSAQSHSLVRRSAWEAFSHFEMGVNAASSDAGLDGIVPDTTLPTNLDILG